MLEDHGFMDDSKECMNCESIDVGLYLPAPQQYIVMNCKDCEVQPNLCICMAACDKALFNLKIIMVVVLNNKLK